MPNSQVRPAVPAVPAVLTPAARSCARGKAGLGSFTLRVNDARLTN